MTFDELLSNSMTFQALNMTFNMRCADLMVQWISQSVRQTLTCCWLASQSITQLFITAHQPVRQSIQQSIHTASTHSRNTNTRSQSNQQYLVLPTIFSAEKKINSKKSFQMTINCFRRPDFESENLGSIPTLLTMWRVL